LKTELGQSIRDVFSDLGRGGVWAAADQGVISLSNFTASVLLAVMVSPEELGKYLIGFLLLYFIRAIQNGVIIQPLNTIGAAKPDEEFRSFFTATFFHQLIFSLLFAGIVLIIRFVSPHLIKAGFSEILLGLSLCFFAWPLQEFFRRVFYARSKVSLAFWVSLSANLIRLSIIVVGSRLGEVRGLSGLMAIGWGSLFAGIIGAWFARKWFTSRDVKLVESFRENWQFGRWIVGASLADWVVVDLYPIMMGWMISLSATGVYQALQNLVAPIHVLLRAIDTFMTPGLAKAYDRFGLVRVNQKLKGLFLLAGIPIIILLGLVLLFAPQLLFLLKGETYLPYANGIFLMAGFYFFLYVHRILQMGFRAVRQGKPIFWANLLAILSMIAGGLWLINRWGIYGAIGGQALNAFILSCVLFIAWRKLIRGQIK